MSLSKNIGKNLNEQFENHNYLPQKLGIEDLSMGFKKFVESFNFSLIMENGISRKVPVTYIAQELFAEKKINWKEMRNEGGEEMTRPYIAILRSGVKKGTSPTKYTIPNKKKFTFIKVPTFDGSLKGVDLYKIPQPTYVDIEFDLKFIAHYTEDVDAFHELLFDKMYSSGQGYMNINGYYITSKLNGDPSDESSLENIAEERIYQISVPILVHGKIIDPTIFEKVNTINKISINISEKK
jgi:hypothetical protein